jgi:glucokinase
MSEIAIGVDVGATKIASALVTRDGKIIAARQINTDVSGGVDAVVQRIAKEIDALAAQANEKICGVGIGVPGLVNPNQGVVITAVNMGWHNVALRDQVRRRIGVEVPVQVENDVRVATRGEFLFGAARGIQDFCLLYIGSGLGSAAMVNGSVIHGANYFASELGHFVIEPNGRVCTCGLRGCAETVLSGRGLMDTTREVLPKYPASSLDIRVLTTNSILGAARAGDPAARAAIQKMGEWLGIIMATASAWLNPARIILGGGLGIAAFDLLYAPARASYAQRVLKGSQEGVELVRSQVDSSAVGAAALVL